ncbi:MAG: alkaline phosphatase [Pseudomonadales bacterium]|jgi:alkaline phosphatase|nr:alkaline phosphatase [Gammaproteobacteria bacterium]MCH1597890.1 alkaline phosphatase [Pseudomonadales bacterium]RPG30768.1 MAG: alkaline phosphatase [Gammaproteobacteria bacterium TMED243]
MNQSKNAQARWQGVVQLGLALALVLASGQSYAKNVIFFLGDGMGISTVTAARIYAGQTAGATGEEYSLAFEEFPHLALIKTYNTDAQVPDSAGTITALTTGEKTRIGVLGINGTVARDDCAAALQNTLPTLAELAEQAGMGTGVVSTARITHATPAGAYAHTPNRNWESSATTPDDAQALGCQDIASQLVAMPFGDGIDVILGGGRREFMPTEMSDPEYPNKQGARDDGRNLIDEWLAADSNRRYAWNGDTIAQWLAAPEPLSGQLMGLFEPSHMQYEADRARDPGKEPSLRDMTALAVKQLSAKKEGYFLLVEAGRIDHAHHFSNAFRALGDTVALSEAVQWVVDNVDLSETLILVTADHSHTMTISGYPRRGNPILGTVEMEPGKPMLDATGKPYTTLSYANGPGYRKQRPDLSDVDTQARNFQQLGTVPMQAETHAGEDVAAFATGANATAVRGVMEQNRLFNVMYDALFEQ